MGKIKRLFADGSRFSDALASFRHMLVINVLWVVCSLPVVTFGAASAAALATLRLTGDAVDVKSGKAFFAYFKEHFSRATKLWLILALLALPIALLVMLFVNSGLHPVAVGAGCVYILLYALMFTYSFQVLIRSEGTAAEVIVFSLMAGLRYFHWSVLALIPGAVPVLMFFFAPEAFISTLPLWLLYAFSFMAYLQQLILKIPFRKLAEIVDFLNPEQPELSEEFLTEY